MSHKLNSAQTVKEYIDKRLFPMINKAIEINDCIIKIINLYRDDLHDYKRIVGIPLPT